MGKTFRYSAILSACLLMASVINPVLYSYAEPDVSGQVIFEYSNSEVKETEKSEKNTDSSIKTEPGYYSYSAAESYVNENEMFSCLKFRVRKGEVYRINASVWGWACLYKIIGKDGNVIEIFDCENKYRTDVAPEEFDLKVNIPEGASEILISYLNSSSAVIEKIQETSVTGVKDNTENISSAAGSSFSRTGFSYAVSKTLCIGDSLTSGAYFRAPLPRNMKTGDSVNQNYPYYLKRMNNMDMVTNAGVSGITVNCWLTSEYKKYKMSDYDSFIIWLGTNNGIQGSIENDVTPFKNYSQYANTGVGNYCTIIEKIKEENPDCLIMMCTVYGTTNGADVNQTNSNIRAIAEKYSIDIIDMSDLSYESRPDLHGNYNNIHFTKAGNIYVASRILDKIDSILSSDPLKAEFGLSERKD